MGEELRKVFVVGKRRWSGNKEENGHFFEGKQTDPGRPLGMRKAAKLDDAGITTLTRSTLYLPRQRMAYSEKHSVIEATSRQYRRESKKFEALLRESTDVKYVDVFVPIFVVARREDVFRGRA